MWKQSSQTKGIIQQENQLEHSSALPFTRHPPCSIFHVYSTRSGTVETFSSQKDSDCHFSMPKNPAVLPTPFPLSGVPLHSKCPTPSFGEKTKTSPSLHYSFTFQPRSISSLRRSNAQATGTPCASPLPSSSDQLPSSKKQLYFHPKQPQLREQELQQYLPKQLDAQMVQTQWVVQC